MNADNTHTHTHTLKHTHTHSRVPFLNCTVYVLELRATWSLTKLLSTTQKLHSGFLRIFGAGVKKQVFEDITDQNTVCRLTLTRCWVSRLQSSGMWSEYFGETNFFLKMEAKWSSETLLRMYKTGRRRMSEHRNLNQWPTLGGFFYIFEFPCITSL